MNKQISEQIRQLEFRIAFSETNLRELANHPDSEWKRKCVKLNQESIEEAKRGIEVLKPLAK